MILLVEACVEYPSTRFDAPVSRERLVGVRLRVSAGFPLFRSIGFELGDRELVRLDDLPVRKPDGKRRGLVSKGTAPPDAVVTRVATEIRNPAGTDSAPQDRIFSLDPAPDEERNQNQKQKPKPPCVNVHSDISVAVGGGLERLIAG